MQIYADLPQITNKHPVAERAGIPHHLLGHIGWENSEYTVKEFEREALSKIEEIQARGKLPILVGGTHYYNQAVMFKNSTIGNGSDVEDGLSEKTLTEKQLEILNGPSAGVLAKLREVDVDVANKFHPNDTRRIRRALEIYFQTGQRPSDIYEAQRTATDEDEKLSLRFDKTLVFWVWCEQSVLNPRLDTRVDAMLRNGLHDEIRELFHYYTAHRPEKLGGVYQVIGFKEFLPWLEAGGDVTVQQPAEEQTEKSNRLLQECIDKMKQRTRKYSKQQTKFMKNTLMPKLAEMVEQDPSRTDIAAAVLDATDLSQWDSTVAKRGIEIARAFLMPQENASAAVDHFFADTPELRSLLVTPKQFTKDQWQNFTCDTCVDPITKQPVVVVGGDRWAVHLKSRKHRNAVAGRAKLEHNRVQMELRRKRQLEEAADSSEQHQRDDGGDEKRLAAEV